MFWLLQVKMANIGMKGSSFHSNNGTMSHFWTLVLCDNSFPTLPNVKWQVAFLSQIKRKKTEALMQNAIFSVPSLGYLCPFMGQNHFLHNQGTFLLASISLYKVLTNKLHTIQKENLFKLFLRLKNKWKMAR